MQNESTLSVIKVGSKVRELRAKLRPKKSEIKTGVLCLLSPFSHN